MKAFLLYFIVSAIAIASFVQCTRREPSPEDLIEQQPSGAGAAQEIEPRPGYFRRLP